MKIAIIFDSHTGNTALVANRIKEACANEEIIYYGHPQKIDNADLIFIGSWVDKGNCSKLIQDYLAGLSNQKIAFFATAGFGGSKEYYDNLANRFDSFITNDNQIIGHFFCPGKMPLATRERYIKMIQEHPDDKRLKVNLDNFDNALLHPDASDLNNASNFALQMIAKI